MKKIINIPRLTNQLLIAGMIAILASCAAGSAGDDNKSKMAQITEYKQQVHNLEVKIAKLEKELKDSSDVERVQVVLSSIEKKKFEHFIEVTGSVEADEEIIVSPESAGQILEIKVKEGEWVSKGTIMATLNSDPIDKTIEQVKINLDLAKTTYDRQKSLWDQNIGSELQYLQAKSSKESLEKQLESLVAQKDMSIIKAPLDGAVDIIYQKGGQIAGPQIPFARLVNIDKVKIYADVAESYLTKIKRGDEALVDFPALGKSVVTRINLIGNYIDPNNRTFRVRIDLPNRDKLIKPNLDAVVKIRDYVAESAIVVPSILIKEDFKGKYSFIASNDGGSLNAKKVYLKTGVTENNMTEVTAGLSEGMKIISEGFGQVVDGTPIASN